MPGNYTYYDPNQVLSQAHIDALAKSKKIISARMLYNKVQLKFLLDPKKSKLASALFNISYPQFEGTEQFIKATFVEVRNYNIYIEYIETCRTVAAFDDLYFQFLIESRSQLSNVDRVNKRILKSKRIPGMKKSQSIEESETFFEDNTELKYYKEIFDILRKHISQCSYEFTQHFNFSYTTIEKNPILQIDYSPLGGALFTIVKKLNKRLRSESIASFTEDQSHQYSTFKDNYVVIQRILKSKFYPENLPAHALDSCESFKGYKKVRYLFDLCTDFLYKGNQLLQPLPTVLPAGEVQEDVKIIVESLNALVIEQEPCAEALTETAPPVVVHVQENITQALQKELLQRVSNFTETKQKSDTSSELRGINPALQFIAALSYEESATLLRWATKAPHLEVALTELEKTTRKLKGKIDTSGGGSHFRIEFKQSLAFVDAFEQNPTENKAKEKTAKGTLVRSHGPGKSSRFLPSYSIETFMQTLAKMGVTEPILRAYICAHGKDITRLPSTEQDKARLLANAHIALKKDQSEMLFFLCVYKGKKNQKGDYPALRKLNPVWSGGKEVTQRLIRTVFSFL